jgi:hypothetical protein
MLRRILHITAFSIVLLAALTPLAETIDTWDHNLSPEQDTELHIVAWCTGAGIVLAAMLLHRAAGRVAYFCAHFLEPQIACAIMPHTKSVSESGAGPPLTSPLRI